MGISDAIYPGENPDLSLWEMGVGEWEVGEMGQIIGKLKVGQIGQSKIGVNLPLVFRKYDFKFLTKAEIC